MTNLLKKLALLTSLMMVFCSVYGADLNALAKHAGVSRQSLENAISKAVYQQKIIDAITTPSESKPWWQYRNIFITTSRIENGVKFYLANEKTLKLAESTYGVPAEIICAIIGVETFYGKNMGNWKALDALYTLGFHYPKREAYFSKEFANLVRLCQDEQWEITSVKGSYAGAMGMGQFMPSSYLDYAVDFDGDGKKNLFLSSEDAIGSVANYFKRHGWQSGRGIFYPAHLNSANADRLLEKKWDLTVDELYSSGVSTKVSLSPGQKIRFFSWPLEDGNLSYGVGLNNFNVIMRYNTSPLYARAVYELSEYIRQGYEKYQLKRGHISAPEGRMP
ncbi:MAG: lytic murein transglycosylase B [Succinivibrio sp.]|nr:lytic murein transglycosylase B [Succinivibrio sp.]